MRQRGLWAAIRHRIRIARLNSRAGIQIARSAYLAEDARLQTESDGHFWGGRIRIEGGATISNGAILATYGGAIEIEANAYIGPYCVLYGHGGLIIGRNVMIGAHTVIVPANHGFARTDLPMNAQPLTHRGITIGQDVWIGAGCRLLDGVHIGDGALIGAGAVVTKNVERRGVALGVPARVVRSRAAGGGGEATSAARP
jgi:acetyltransferase-like isoleucine patch superfamily enzyme